MILNSEVVNRVIGKKIKEEKECGKEEGNAVKKKDRVLKKEGREKVEIDEKVDGLERRRKRAGRWERKEVRRKTVGFSPPPFFCFPLAFLPSFFKPLFILKALRVKIKERKFVTSALQKN